MIVFQDELPLDHSRSLSYMAKKWAYDIYADEEGTVRLNKVKQYPLCMFYTDLDYYLEEAWKSIGEHLWSEGHKVIVPVGATYSSLRETTITFGGDYV